MINRIVSKVRGGSRSSTKQRGQSLVEFAITLPILLIILVGLGEMGSALYSYQIVANAAREGARYGAKALHTPDEVVAAWTRQAADRLKITTVVDDVPVLDGEKATIVVTRLRKSYSDGECTYEIIRTYPSELDPERPTILTEEWLNSQEGKSEQLDWPQGIPNQAMDLIAVEVMYDHPHLTGFFNIGRFIPDPIPFHSITVMRVGGSRMATCDAYPIGVPQDVLDGHDPGDNLGDIYEGGGPGNFGWLRWPQATSAGNEPYLSDSLGNPGLSRRDYDNALDPSDHWLNVDDWVWGSSGISGSAGVTDALDALIGRRIRVPVWGPDDDPASDGFEGTGSGGHYHIVGFAWVIIRDYGFQGNQSWINADFIGMDETCTPSD